MVDWKMSGFREEVNTKTAKICKQSFGQQGPPKLVGALKIYFYTFKLVEMFLLV